MDNYSYKNAAVRVCFDHKNGEEFCGRIFTPYRKEGTEFYNAVTLLLEVEAIAEERGFPSAACICRNFKKKKTSQRKKVDIQSKDQRKIFRTMEELSKEHGQTDTLLVYVTSRMHANMQGHIVCLKDKTKALFESELEFIKICEERFSG